MLRWIIVGPQFLLSLLLFGSAKSGWVRIGFQLFLALVLVTSVKQRSKLFLPANAVAIALASSVAIRLRELEKQHEDCERKDDMLFALKEVQGEEQLQFLETAAESKHMNQEADKQLARQLKMLQETAPLFSELLNVTGRNGAIERMALGLLQGGSGLGEVLVATADAEIKLELARLSAELQQRQIELQISSTNSQATPTVTAQPAIAQPENSKVDALKKVAMVVGVKTECVKVDAAPSHERLIFSLRTEDYALLPKWKAAAKVGLGIKVDVPFYIYGENKIAVELAIPPEKRTFFDFPTRDWKKGDRTIVLGKSLDGEVTIDLADENTPQLLVAGTTGSGKSNFLKAAAYALLMQGAKVDICGGKVADYEIFPPVFPTINVSDMGKTAEFVKEYFAECDRRNGMRKDELTKQPAWILIIDEYKGTVPYDEKLRKTYDQQLCEVTRRGRGLKIHVIIGLQRGSKRTKDDPQALPPDLRDNLPCRVAFRCVDATGGRMVLHQRGETVTSLQGRGDGIVQAGALDTRFQAYRFEEIPDAAF